MDMNINIAQLFLEGAHFLGNAGGSKNSEQMGSAPVNVDLGWVECLGPGRACTVYVSMGWQKHSPRRRCPEIGGPHFWIFLVDKFPGRIILAPTCKKHFDRDPPILGNVLQRKVSALRQRMVAMEEAGDERNQFQWAKNEEIQYVNHKTRLGKSLTTGSSTLQFFFWI